MDDFTYVNIEAAQRESPSPIVCEAVWFVRRAASHSSCDTIG